MKNGEQSIADLARGYTKKEEVQGTVFEETEGILYPSKIPFLTKKIIQHSFGLITDESKVNKVILLLVGIFLSAIIAFTVQTNSPKNKIPPDVLRLNMERMRSK